MLTWTTASFIPPTTTADPGALATQAQTLMDQSGRIIGRGSEVAQQMTTTAVDFSELVAAPLKQHSGFSLQASERAMEGAAWGSTVTSRWSTEVQTFIDTTTALKTDWDTAVGNHFGISRSAYPTVEEFHNAVNAAGAVKYQEVSTAANAAYDTFKAQAAAVGQQLAGGPTPANLQALAAGGAGGSWAMFNLFGAQAGLPTLDRTAGSLLADQIRGFIDRGEAIPSTLLDVVKQLALDAQALQQAGTGPALPPGQIDYLGGLFERLDVTGTLERLPEAIRALVPAPGDQTMMLGALGGGLLALSDSRVGGGANRLPPSLAGLIDRQLGTGGGVAADGATHAHKIAPMLAALRAPSIGLEQLEGGKELSAALTLEVAQSNLMGQPTFLDDARSDVLDIATRNNDANYELLTGVLQNPDFGAETNEYVLRGIFGHDWKDHGLAAGRLIDWIPEEAGSNDQAVQNRAAEAAFKVFTIMTDKTKPNPPFDVSAYDFFTDSFGTIGSFQNAPLGQGNPEITLALGRTAAAYFDVLSMSNSPAANTLTLSNQDGATDMFLKMDTRRDLVELIMGGDASRNAFGEAAYKYAIANASYADQWQADEVAHSEAMAAGTLMGLLDHGFQQVFDEANIDGSERTALQTEHVNWARAGASAAKEIVTELPYVRGLGRAAQQIIRQITEASKWSPGVLQASDLVWASGVAPKAGDFDFTGNAGYEEYTFGATYKVIEHLVKTPGSGIDIEAVRAANPNLVEFENGQWQITDSKTLMENIRYTFRDATRDLQGLIDDDTDRILDNYLRDYQLRRNN
jgi:uncharacterized protein (DUF697 family)